MGLSKKEGQYWFDYAISNRKRKEKEKGSSYISWKMSNDNTGISGFTYMHRSDEDPSYGGISPFWARDPNNIVKIIDSHLSSHLETLKPAGMKYVGTFLIDELLQLEGLYSKFGFEFDSVYSYEKLI